jgi:prevent-host-death family protein
MAKAASNVVPATQFKAQCLALIDRVAEGKGAIVISKRGRPVARLVAIDETSHPARKPLVGSVTIADADDDLFSTRAVWKSQTRRRP